MTKVGSIISILLISTLLFVSCNRNRVYQEYVEIPDNVWEANNIVKLSFDIEDTIVRNSVYINIRHSGHYPFKNLWLFTTTTAPNGFQDIDTVEIFLADDKGKWLGDGLGDIWDNKFEYKKNIRFPLSGTYNVEIEQGMRFEKLPGIMDVGMSIEIKKDDK